MAADGKVRIQIETNAGKATNELKGFDKAVKDVQKDGGELTNSNNMLQNSMNRLTSAAKGLVGAYLGLQGIRAVTNYVNQSVEAFREEQRAILSLETTLINTGVYTQEYAQHIRDLADAIQMYSNYGNEATLKAISLGQAYAGQTRLTDDLIRATVDFAAATGKDLESAFTLVGKSIGSSTNALSRYGVELKEGMTDSQKLDAITKQLGSSFAGQAQNMSDASVQLKNALGEVAKQIGAIFNPSVLAATNRLIKATYETKKWIETLRIMNSDVKNLNAIDELNTRLEKNNKNIKLTEDSFNKLDATAKASATRRLANLRKENEEIAKRINLLKTEEAKKVQQSKSSSFKMTDDIVMPSFSTGKSSSITSHTQQVQQAKTAYEQLQIAVTNARNAVLNAAVTYGTSSEQVQNAMMNYRNVNAQMTEIQKVFDDQTKESTFNIEKFGESIKNNLGSSLISVLRGGQNAFQVFGNIAINILDDIIKETIKAIEWEQVWTAIKTAGKAIGGFLGFSKGGAFQNGIQKFASGGVVNQPITFPMASGKTGLMGEAGAEAIMPLKRTASGDLGIQATQPNINIYNQSGSQIETVTRPNGDIDLFIKRVNNALSNERTQQGFSNALQRNNSRGLQAS